MHSTFKPQNADQLREAVAWAVAEGRPLEVRGAGTKGGVGRPLQTDVTVDLTGLADITLYEPEELVLSARAGTRLTDIEAELAAKGQELAFEPPDYGPLFGLKPGAATLGGVLGANASGPRRIKAGAARDHFLGVAAVSGRGESFKAGGRVVKNVTGYDMCKGLAGSWGTLAVMSDVTVKVLPAGETSRSIVVAGLCDGEAMQAMSAAMGSSCEVSGAAHLPERVAAGLDLKAAATVLRLEGFAPSVAYRSGKLAELLTPFGSVHQLDPEASSPLWQKIRDVAPFAADPARPLWRISVPPSQGAKTAARISAGLACDLFYDWAGGLIWVQLAESSADAGAAVVRAAFAASGGHATLFRADAATRAALAVFQPQAAPLAALSERVRASFDPHGLLNPGRLYASGLSVSAGA